MATHLVVGGAAPTSAPTHYESLLLGGREIHYLFLSPEMLFYRYLLKESLQSPAMFLTGRELMIWNGLDVSKRRIEWLAGRLNAKLLLGKVLGSGYDFQNFEILPGAGGRPVATMKLGSMARIPLGNGLSLSHREGATLSAVSAGPAVRVGADVELMEPRSELMLDDYFSAGEAAVLAGLPGPLGAHAIALGWSIKESVLKAVGRGLTLPATAVVIERISARAGMAEARLDDGQEPGTFLVHFEARPPHIITLTCAAP